MHIRAKKKFATLCLDRMMIKKEYNRGSLHPVPSNSCKYLQTFAYYKCKELYGDCDTHTGTSLYNKINPVLLQAHRNDRVLYKTLYFVGCYMCSG